MTMLDALSECEDRIIRTEALIQRTDALVQSAQRILCDSRAMIPQCPKHDLPGSIRSSAKKRSAL